MDTGGASLSLQEPAEASDVALARMGTSMDADEQLLESGFATSLPPLENGCAAGCCVRFCGARRIGNMALLWEEPQPEDPANPRRIILGPFWPMLVLCTYPLIIGVSLAMAITMLPGQPWWISTIFGVVLVVVLVSLACTACTDPGMLRRHAERPSAPDGESWNYSDQAQTYRPVGAIYCRDCGVVVRGYDHLCPWTGTAIGERNLRVFYCFVASVNFLLFYVLFIVVYGIWTGDKTV
jgi:hypothetical protein